MTRNEFIQHLEKAASDGTLMTPKHDPANLSTIYSQYRSVLSYETAQNLETFIKSEQYTITEYENREYPNSPLYFKIEPTDASTFSVPASGVPPNSLSATSTLNCLVTVSGHNQGWHVFGESSVTVQQKESSGDLDKKCAIDQIMRNNF